MAQKRSMWIGNCLVWAGIWFVLGLFFIPFWIFTVVSVMMIMLPVGVSEYPDKPYKVRHDAAQWRQHQ